jgi:hypothetical protein
MARQIRLQRLRTTTPRVKLEIFFEVALNETLSVLRLLQREEAILFLGIHPETHRFAASKERQPLTIDSGDTVIVERVVYDSRKTILMQ